MLQLHFDCFGCRAAVRLSRFDGVFKRNVLENILVKEFGLSLKFVKRQIIKSLVVFNAVSDGLTDDSVSVSERQAFLNEVVGHISCRREAVGSRLISAFAVDFHLADHRRHNFHRALPEINRFIRKELVFLHVFVVGKRNTFHHGEHGLQVAVHAAGATLN